MQGKKTIVFEGYSRRLDVFVADTLENLSRSLVQKLIKDGHVTVNGKTVKPSWPLTPGETIVIELPQAQSKMKLNDLMLFDGKDFFALIKPAGMLVHPQSPIWEEHLEAAFSAEETLASIILASPPKGFDLATPRAGLVHRLDRETSGVMIVAKTPQFQAEMVSLFANREVHKTYHAIACGEVPDEQGTIDVPIGRVAGGKIKASNVGREAVTEYKVVERKNGFTYIELYPKTGRTNQLRVHLNWLGYPVLGDWLYKGATAERLMLHARKIEFKHPLTGRKYQFEAPVPEDFLAAWERVTTSK